MSDGAQCVMGMVSGIVWDLASLGCLSRLLHAWLAPRRAQRRALGWGFAKAVLLGLLVYLFTRVSPSFIMGFGLGFTLVLLAAMGWFVLRAQRAFAIRSYGR